MTQVYYHEFTLDIKATHGACKQAWRTQAAWANMYTIMTCILSQRAIIILYYILTLPLGLLLSLHTADYCGITLYYHVITPVPVLSITYCQTPSPGESWQDLSCQL